MKIGRMIHVNVFLLSATLVKEPTVFSFESTYLLGLEGEQVVDGSFYF